MKAYFYCTEPFRKKLKEFLETPLFLGNNRQHMPGCPEMIFPWVMKVLNMAIIQMSVGTLQGAATSAVLVAGVSPGSTLAAGDWSRVYTTAGHYFQLISLLQINSRILGSMLSLALVSCQLIGKCQTLTYVKCYRYVGLFSPVLSK